MYIEIVKKIHFVLNTVHFYNQSWFASMIYVIFIDLRYALFAVDTDAFCSGCCVKKLVL